MESPRQRAESLDRRVKRCKKEIDIEIGAVESSTCPRNPVGNHDSIKYTSQITHPVKKIHFKKIKAAVCYTVKNPIREHKRYAILLYHDKIFSFLTAIGLLRVVFRHEMLAGTTVGSELSSWIHNFPLKITSWLVKDTSSSLYTRTYKTIFILLN
jgi:hypothetical protein